MGQCLIKEFLMVNEREIIYPRIPDPFQGFISEESKETHLCTAFVDKILCMKNVGTQWFWDEIDGEKWCHLFFFSNSGGRLEFTS